MANSDQSNFSEDCAARHAESAGHERPRLRSRLYGKCRARRWNQLAWFLADRHGREVLRRLREIKHEQRRTR